MANLVGKIGMKITTILVGIPVGVATKKAVERTWATVRSEETPRKPNERGVRWGDAISWAALSAAGVVAADLITRRSAEMIYRAVMGVEPPPPKPSKAQKKLEAAHADATAKA